MYIDNKFGRSGIVMVKSGLDNYDAASVSSQNIALSNGGYSKFHVVFSFYSNSMEVTDRFCLDYKANGASTWSRAKCWRNGREFENGQWYDDMAYAFMPPASITNSIRIRFRGMSAESFDRVFFDKIQLFGRTELT